MYIAPTDKAACVQKTQQFLSVVSAAVRATLPKASNIAGIKGNGARIIYDSNRLPHAIEVALLSHRPCNEILAAAPSFFPKMWNGRWCLPGGLQAAVFFGANCRPSHYEAILTDFPINISAAEFIDEFKDTAFPGAVMVSCVAEDSPAGPRVDAVRVVLQQIDDSCAHPTQIQIPGYATTIKVMPVMPRMQLAPAAACPPPLSPSPTPSPPVSSPHAAPPPPPAASAAAAASGGAASPPVSYLSATMQSGTQLGGAGKSRSRRSGHAVPKAPRVALHAAPSVQPAPHPVPAMHGDMHGGDCTMGVPLTGKRPAEASPAMSSVGDGADSGGASGRASVSGEDGPYLSAASGPESGSMAVVVQQQQGAGSAAPSLRAAHSACLQARGSPEYDAFLNKVYDASYLSNDGYHALAMEWLRHQQLVGALPQRKRGMKYPATPPPYSGSDQVLYDYYMFEVSLADRMRAAAMAP